MTENDRVRLEISSIIGEIEESQRLLGPLGVVEYDDISEVIEIVDRIERKVLKNGIVRFKALPQAVASDQGR